MRVVYVSSLPKGGPVSHLLILAPALARAGAEVDVVCGDEDVAEAFRNLGIEASAVALRHKGDLSGARRVNRLIAGADVVHTHDRRAGLLVRPPARIRGARVVHTYHGLPEEIAVRIGREGEIAPRPPGASPARIAWLLHGYLRLEAVLALFGAVVVPSEAMARFLRARGIPASRVHVVPHGIDLPARPPARREPTGDGPIVVGVAANLEYHKGIDVLIEGCALARRPLRLEILGDGTWRARLERLASELGVEARFAGHVSNVEEQLRTMDVLAVPSRAENFPVSILEAMAAGLPVVATRVGGIPELVADDETGLIVEPDDPAALAAALDSLAADPDRRSAFGEAGQRRAAKLFGADRMASTMLALYESLA
jgi:glycosyltransferase involved in cell wall biosynthesis